MVNIELLTKVRDKIANDPDTLDMNEWIDVAIEGLVDGTHLLDVDHIPCGTTACIAGWATLLSGDRVIVGASLSEDRYSSSTVIPKGADPKDYESVSDRAIKLLGLPEYMGRWLFVIDDDDVLWALDQLIAGRGATEDDFRELEWEEDRRITLRNEVEKKLYVQSRLSGGSDEAH